MQIVNIRGNHWCQLNHLNVYDSIPHGDISLREKQQIAALLFTQAKAITLNFPDVQVHVTRHMQLVCQPSLTDANTIVCSSTRKRFLLNAMWLIIAIQTLASICRQLQASV